MTNQKPQFDITPINMTINYQFNVINNQYDLISQYYGFMS